MTVEDPIEYDLKGITQVQVFREKGMDFARVLQEFLRQDPDIMLVGETRDKETAKIAIEAASPVTWCLHRCTQTTHRRQ